LAAIAPSICALVCDVAELADVRRMAIECVGEFGRPDELLSNAGFAVYRLFAKDGVGKDRRRSWL
jgi:NAD(P)-dependent dehydrogenase (short-subunit alcohol dehydrogenase family)